MYILESVKVCRSRRSTHGKFLSFLRKDSRSWLLSWPLLTGSPHFSLLWVNLCFRSCVSVLWVLFSALAYLFNSLWEVSYWLLMGISLNRKNWCDFPQFQNRLFITFQCTVSSVSLPLGETVLQTVELLLLKYLQGKRRKDEQEVLIASNWGE